MPRARRPGVHVVSRPLLAAGYRVGAIPPWLVLDPDGSWSCLQCGWSATPDPSTWRLYVAATTHRCYDLRQEDLDVVDA